MYSTHLSFFFFFFFFLLSLFNPEFLFLCECVSFSSVMRGVALLIRTGGRQAGVAWSGVDGLNQVKALFLT